MTPREILALVSTLLVIVGTSWYIYIALKGNKMKPVLAGWIVMGCTMTLSFATYWTTPNRNLVSNACNAISVVSSCSIMFLAIWLTIKEGKSVSFNKFQKICLAISSVIAIFWIVLVWGFKGTGIVPNILTQVLMVIGYLFTAEKLWKAKGCSESFFMWWCVSIASAFALYTAIVSYDRLAILYATRATLTSFILVSLMYRAKRREEVLVS